MRSQIRFFATKGDLLPVLASIEQVSCINYVQFGPSATADPVRFVAASAIPNRGIASNDSAINCTTYLICRNTVEVRPRLVGGRYVFDQLLNPETVTFTPGGIWEDEILLYGRFATASTNPIAADLMKHVGAAVRSRLPKMKAFHVGPEALQMLNSGHRLAIAAQSPRTLDLARS